MSLAWLVCRVVGLSTPREKPLQQAACGFRWSCSSDTPQNLGNSLINRFSNWFKAVEQLTRINFGPICVQTEARMRLFPLDSRFNEALHCSISSLLTPYQSMALYCFVNGEDAAVSLVTGHGKSIFIPLRCSISFERTWNSTSRKIRYFCRSSRTKDHVSLW